MMIISFIPIIITISHWKRSKFSHNSWQSPLFPATWTALNAQKHRIIIRSSKFQHLDPIVHPMFPYFSPFFPYFSRFFFWGPGDLGGVAAAATRQVGWAAEAAPGGTAVPGISGKVPWGSSMGGHVNWGNLIRWGRTGGCCGNHKWEICGNSRGNF